MDLYIMFYELFENFGLVTEWGIILNDFVSSIMVLIVILMPVLIIYSMVWRMIKRW